MAAELARRLEARGHRVDRTDVLALLPAGLGPGLRSGYRATIRHLPVLYEGIYAAFFRPGAGPRPGSAPLAALAGPRLLDLVERWRPDVVVPVFHLAAQLTGRLRADGRLSMPSAVVVTDFAVHRQWLLRVRGGRGPRRRGSGAGAPGCGSGISRRRDRSRSGRG
ncbi:hypothetical protein SPAR_43536, partial [Streptomyces sparsogenes DSM 40356]